MNGEKWVMGLLRVSMLVVYPSIFEMNNMNVAQKYTSNHMNIWRNGLCTEHSPTTRDSDVAAPASPIGPGRTKLVYVTTGYLLQAGTIIPDMALNPFI